MTKKSITSNQNIDISSLQGTKFQKLVWRALCDIPKGTCITYKQLAKRIGKPTSIRAVANAVGANPCAPIIPCHRVVRTDGGLGGYSGVGGIVTKRALLKSEGVLINNRNNV